MKRFTLLSLILFLGATLFTGCAEDNTDQKPNGPVRLELSQNEVTVPAEGGHFTIQYQLENPIDGAELRVSSQHGWVTNFDTSIPGEISFDVRPSYEESERSSHVELVYPEVYPNKTFTVKQAVGMEPSFTFNVKKVMSNTIIMDVIPTDKTQPYIFLLGPKEYMIEDNLLEDDAAQIASDLEQISNFGEAFGATLKDVIGAFIYTGEQIDYTWNGVSRNTEYVAYAYGFDTNTLQPTTEVCRVEIKTLDVEEYIVNFDLDVKTDGANVSFDITPKGYDGYYFFGVFYAEDVEGVSEDAFRSYCEAEWENYKGLYSPFFDNVEEGLHFIFNELAYQGTTHFETELEADTEYILWVFGMNDEALMNTKPQQEHFRTGGAKPSENMITLTVQNIKSRQVDILVEPSNDDPYIATLVTADKFAGMSDEEIMIEICTKWDYTEAHGGFSQTVTGLSPETEYHLIAFGINGGRPSTKLFKTEFKTQAAVISDAQFELKLKTIYDIAEVAQLLPSWSEMMQYDFICPVEAVVDEKAKEVYFSTMEAENFAFFTQDSNEPIIEALLSEGPAQELDTHFLLNYNLEFVFFGFVIDQDGNYTDLWHSEPITFEKSQCGDAQDFVNSLETSEPATRKDLQVKTTKEATKGYLTPAP